jgi:hypothetical protein
MLAAKDTLREESNIGEYPMPPNACHTSFLYILITRHAS